MLAAAPPRALIDRLTRENIPLSVGHSVVATVEPHEQAVLAAIHDLELDWHVIFNKGSAMALPSDVTKASGLRPVVEALGRRQILVPRAESLLGAARIGVWTAPGGHTEQDDVVMVEVVTDMFDQAWWRTYAAMLAERFGQDSIHVRAVPVEVLHEEGSASQS